MGNELALIEDEDMLGEDLAHIESLGVTDHDQNIQKSPIHMIEASDFGESGAAKGANEKALTRNMTRSVCPEPQQVNQRRASPRINPKQVQQVNVSRARRGLKQTSSIKVTPGRSTQQKGMVDAKYPPHRHQ